MPLLDAALSRETQIVVGKTMLFGVFTALATLLSSLRPRLWGGRRRHRRRGRGRRRRIWGRRRSNYRSLVQREGRRKSDPASSTDGSAAAAEIPTTLDVFATLESESSVDERRESPSAATQDRSYTTANEALERCGDGETMRGTSGLSTPSENMNPNSNPSLDYSVIEDDKYSNAVSPKEEVDTIAGSTHGSDTDEITMLKSIKKYLEGVSGVSSECTENPIESSITDTTSEFITRNQMQYEDADSTTPAVFLSTVTGSTEGHNFEDKLEQATSADTVKIGGSSVDKDLSMETPAFDVEVSCYTLNTLTADDDSLQGTDNTPSCTSNSESQLDTLPLAIPSYNDDEDTCKAKDKSAVYDVVDRKGVALERIHRAADGCSVVGTVLVRNESFQKCVGARHSITGWETTEDTHAQWVESIEDGMYDRFQFQIDVPAVESYRMELAFYYNEYWDNNEGRNHVVSCQIL